jgi:hypothetical protein
VSDAREITPIFLRSESANSQGEEAKTDSQRWPDLSLLLLAIVRTPGRRHPTAMALTVRRTEIADYAPSDEDWCVLFHGEPVGRICKQQVGANASQPWGWSITLALPAVPGRSHSGAPDFATAKVQWREGWDAAVAFYGIGRILEQLARSRENREAKRQWTLRHCSLPWAREKASAGGPS